jgi:ATP-dependent Clp protease ATP-binding subunit ClpC
MSGWDRFTKDAQMAVFHAQEEAAQLEENHVSTEHLLLGLIGGWHDPNVWPPPPSSSSRSLKYAIDAVTAHLLRQMAVTPESIRVALGEVIARGSGRSKQDMQLTPRAKTAIDFAFKEAKQLNNNYIGTEHLLLGLIREGEGLAGRVLSRLGVTVEQARQEVVQWQGGVTSSPPEHAPKRPWWRIFGP